MIVNGAAFMDRDPLGCNDGAIVVILTALNTEHRSVRRFLSSVRRVDHPAGTIFEVGWLPGGQGRAALAVTGPGNSAAAILAERAIAMFRPRALMFVGVAGALHDEIALGDVVVATKVYAYHGGDVRPDGFRPRPRSWDVPHQLDQVARRVHRLGSWTALLAADRQEQVPAVHFGPVAAGEVVLKTSDGPLRKQLLSTYGDAVAIEMESAGAAQAGYLNQGLPVLSVRGISDRADGDKREADQRGGQAAAAAHAAAFALAVAADLCAAAPEDAGERPWLSPRAAPAVIVPRQLPAPPGLLVGRAAHLSALDESLRRPGRGATRITVLTGMAGAGKTALAVHWAHAAAADFPDGQLYADVRGFGPDPPLWPEEVLAGFLRALGQAEAAERGTLTERAARFRTALSGRRVLIVVDNAASVEQVRPLLPGTGSCAVLITSRQRLRGLTVHHAAQVVEAGPLPMGDAVALLHAAAGERITAEPSGAELLARRCSGLPLALRIAAELVTAHPAQDLPGLVAESDDGADALTLLDTGDDQHSAVRTVFWWSYRSLPGPVAAGFRLLALHPGNSFALPAAAALLGVPLAQARTVLLALVNAHLVQPVPGRFDMHDLLRRYAGELTRRDDDEPTRRAATRRMFDYYLHTADRAGRLIMPHRYRIALDGTAVTGPGIPRRSAAVRWFAEERLSLMELCRLEAAEFDARRWQLAYVLRDYFYLSKHLDGWLETHQRAVAACERLGDRRAEGITRNNLGRALLETGRLDEAAAEYRRAHALLTAAADEQGVTDSLVNLASVRRRQGAFAEALRDQAAARAFYRQAGLGRKEGIALRGMARTELALGRLAEAAGHAEEALARFTDLGLDLDAAQSLCTLTQIYGESGATGRAEAAGHRAIEYSQRAGSDYEEARALHQLGRAAAQAGQTRLARERLAGALAILDRLGAAEAAALVRSELSGPGATGSGCG